MKKYLETYSIARREKRLENYKKLVWRVEDLRGKGFTFQDIAKKLNLRNRQQAHEMFQANKNYQHL